MASEKTEIEIKGLDKLAKAFKKVPEIHVGILGNGAKRDGGLSNAQIGAFHEFGNHKVPMRSFLRIPLSKYLDAQLKKDGVIEKKSVDNAVKLGTLTPIMKQIAVAAEGVVLDAFASAGFGEWKPLAPETLQRKKVQQILVETQQLRNSITSEIVEGENE